MDLNPNLSALRTSGGRSAAAQPQDGASASSPPAARLPESPLSPRGQAAAGTSSLAPRAALPPVGAAAQAPTGAAPPHGSATAAQVGQPAQGRAPAADPATYLEVHRRLTQGDKLPAICRALGVNVLTAQHYFNPAARLLVSSRADSLLRSADESQRRAFEAMPRALRPIELARLVEFLQRQADRSGDALRAAGAREGIPPSVLDHLFDAAGLRQARAAALPEAQRDAIVGALASPPPAAGEASVPRPAPAAEAPPRARRAPSFTAERISALREAQQRMMAGQSAAQAATGAGIPITAVSVAFGMEGRLLLTRAGQSLLELQDAQQRQAFEAMPRALRHRDLMILLGALRLAPGAAPAELRAAVEREGMSPEAIAFLFDEAGIRRDQLALLPAAQSHPLTESLAIEAEEAPAEPPDAPEIRLAGAFATTEMLHEAQALLAAGVAHADVADRLNVGVGLLELLFDRRGHLLVGRTGARLMSVANAQVRAAAQGLPRSLRPNDLRLLLEVFSAQATAPARNLRQAAADAQVSRHALAYLFEGDQPGQAAMDALPEDQQVALRHALSGTPAEVAWSRYREGLNAGAPARLSGPPVSAERAGRFLQAARLIAAGTSRAQAGRQAGIPNRSIGHALDPQGRILINKEGQGLLRVEDPQLRAQLQALPRALAQGDLQLLAEVFRRQIESPAESLHRAAVAAGVSVHALNHLFDLHQQLREDAIEALPEEQQDALLNPEAAPAAAPTGGRHRIVGPLRATGIAEVQQLLADGRTLAEAIAVVSERHPGTHLAAAEVSRALDPQGRLLLGGLAATLLRIPDPGQRAAFEGLPRALRGIDLNRLDELLRKHAAAPLPDLRQAAVHAGVGTHAVDYLFDGPSLREDRLAALPEPQLRQLLAARAGMAAPVPAPVPVTRQATTQQAVASASGPRQRQNVQAPARRPGPPVSVERAGRLLQAAHLLAAGAPREQAAEAAGSSTALRHTMNAQGRIFVNQGGQSLMHVADPQLRAELQALPRVLGQRDLALLTEVFGSHRESPLPSVHQAAVAAGVSEHALGYLFDEHQRVRPDRIDALPQAQRDALRSPEAGMPAPVPATAPRAGARPSNPRAGPNVRAAGSQPGPVVSAERAGRLLEAARLLAAGGSREQAAEPHGIYSAVRHTLDVQGRILVNEGGRNLLRVEDPQLRAELHAWPRALAQGDLALLANVLRRHREASPRSLHQAAATAGVSAHALEHLFDEHQRLRQDGVDALPPAQRDALRDAAAAAAAGSVHTGQFMAPLRSRAMAEVQQLLAAGRSFAEATALANERHAGANLAAYELTRAFDPQGRLVLGRMTNTLLRIPDPALRGVFENLPRTLRSHDLWLLDELLRKHAAAPLPDLRQAAIDAGVHAQAVDHLFDGADLRDDRLAALPQPQLRQLLAARAGMPAPVPTVVRHAGPGPSGTAQPATAATRAERPPRPPRPAGPVRVAPPRSAMPGAAEVLAVLRYFREGGDGLTMVRAQRHFNLGAEALIARLARAGVTEAEAWAGTMPDPAVLWQRVRGRAAAQGVALARQEVSAGDFGSLLASLERWLGSPTAERDTAGSRKRVAGPPHEGESSGARPRPRAPGVLAPDARPEPRGARSERARRAEGQWGSMAWGSGPAFTPRVAQASSPHEAQSDEDVLMDPGTPRAGDLEALNVGLERTRTGDVDLTELLRDSPQDRRR